MSTHTPGPLHAADTGCGWELHTGIAPTDRGCFDPLPDGTWPPDCGELTTGHKDRLREDDAKRLALCWNCHDDLLAACEACAAWHWAERECPQHTTTFQERVDLCNYAEWLTLKALAAALGNEPTANYEGLLRVYMDGTSYRPTSDDTQAVVDRIIAAYRKTITKGGAQ